MRALLDFCTLHEMMGDPSEENGTLEMKVMLEYGDVELWTSSVSLVRLADEIEQAIADGAARDAIQDIFTWLRVCPVGEIEVNAAVLLGGGAFEDRLDMVCARQSGADYLVTRASDLPDGPLLPHGTAQEFVEHVAEKTGARYAVVGLAETRP